MVIGGWYKRSQHPLGFAQARLVLLLQKRPAVRDQKKAEANVDSRFPIAQSAHHPTNAVYPAASPHAVFNAQRSME